MGRYLLVPATQLLSLSIVCLSPALAMPALVPQPLELRSQRGSIEARRPWVLDIGQASPSQVGIRELARDLRTVFAQRLIEDRMRGVPVSVVRLSIRSHVDLPAPQAWQRAEAYRLRIARDSVLIEASTDHGCFNGVQTLRQLIRGSRGGQLPQLSIVDYPALQWRGVSDDISRGQASTLADFRGILEHLAYYKLNLYCLYIEDMARLWSAPEVGAARQALTPSELRNIAAEATRYHVTLVPIFETLGHQERLLALPSLSALSDSPPPSAISVSAGKVLWPFVPVLASALALPDPASPHSSTACFSPTSQVTRVRVARMVGDIAASVPSPFFHLGGDEPHTLGNGESRAAIESRGLGAVYADYMNALGHHVIDSLSRHPLIFSDMILANPDAMRLIDRRIGVVDWQYDLVSRGESISRLHAAGFKTVFASPGLWNWTSIFPDFGSAFPNIALQADAARSAGAAGLILSSWGDNGAECLRQSNWPGYAFAGDAAWRRPDSTDTFLRRFAVCEFGTADPRISEALRIVGWQQFPSLGFSQRVIYRPVRVAPRTPAWAARMNLLAPDMLRARAAVGGAFSQVRFRVDELEVLDYAAARYLLTASRETALDRLGSSLVGMGWSRLPMTERDRYTRLLQAAADSSAILDQRYRSLWLRHNRRQELETVAVRQAGMTRDLGNIARAARDGSLSLTGTPGTSSAAIAGH